MREQVLAIVGATGSGKSALADALASQLDGEVVSADSMQVYRGMDIGTGKLPASQRSVAYHCLDLVAPNQDFNAALYQREARRSIDDIRQRGKTAVVCGGTGLYIRAALDDFNMNEAQSPPDRELRHHLQKQAELLGPEDFHALLAQQDPQSAALIHPHNQRRVLRALELLDQGSSYATQSANFASFRSFYSVCYIGLALEPSQLYQRIEQRVEQMLRDGLLNEVRSLVQAGFGQATSLRQAIGYKELLPVLEGKATLAEATEQIKQATRRYAKRQRSWFKRDNRISFVNAPAPTTELTEWALRLIGRC